MTPQRHSVGNTSAQPNTSKAKPLACPAQEGRAVFTPGSMLAGLANSVQMGEHLVAGGGFELQTHIDST